MDPNMETNCFGNVLFQAGYNKSQEAESLMKALFSYSEQVPCFCFASVWETVCLFCSLVIFWKLDALWKGLRGSVFNSVMCAMLCGIFKLSIFLSHKLELGVFRACLNLMQDKPLHRCVAVKQNLLNITVVELRKKNLVFNFIQTLCYNLPLWDHGSMF